MGFLRKLPAAVLLTFISVAAAGDSVEVFKSVRGGVVTVVSAGNGLARPAMALLERARGDDFVLGTGIILPFDGLILTASHAVADIPDLAVVFSDMSEAGATLVASQPLLDIALLRVAKKDLSAVPWRLDKPLEVGETVFTIGTPSAFSADPSPSITAGIVCSLHRAIDFSDDRSGPTGDLIECDCLVSVGESGGALVDGEGRLVGMVLAAHRPHDQSRGRTYALPADKWLLGVIEALSKGAQAPLGDFGTQVAGLGISRARRLGLAPRSGVEVTWVREGGPFAAAGVMPGDVVVSINDQDVRRTTRFRQIEMRLAPGSTAAVKVVRPGAGRTIDLEVAVDAAHHRRDFVEVEFNWRGMRLAGLSEPLRKRLGIHFQNGVLVRGVDSDGPAHRAGLRPGDVIVEINSIEVRSLPDLRKIAAVIPDSNVVRVRTTAGIGHIQGESLKK